MRKQIITQKTLKKIALFLIGLSGIMYSCRKFDVNAPNPHETNFANKFFATEGPTNSKVATIIELLKRQNSREGFVNNLPNGFGLPLWDKLIFPRVTQGQSFGEGDSAETNSIIIPLTSNGYSLSMIITGEKISDSSFLLRWFTSADLYDVCYASDKNIHHAESLLALFMYVESSIYDRTDFYNIPKDLLTNIPGVSQTDSTKHIMLKHKDISIDTDPQTGGFVYWSCWYIPSGQCNCPGPCDWRNPCPTMFCTNIVCVPIEEDPCPGCGGGGTGGGGTGGDPGGNPGGGGGGGGTGGGGGNPPNCGQVFYLVDPCGPPPPPPPPPPQDTLLNPCLHIASLQNNTIFKNMLQVLKDHSNDPNDTTEYGFIYNHLPNNQLTLEGRVGELGKKELDFIYTGTIDGIAHNHFANSLSIFSPDDLWSICNSFNTRSMVDSSKFTLPLITANSTQYILMIENLTKFRLWSQKFMAGNFRLFREAYRGPGIGIKESNTNAENEKRFLLYLLSNNGSGLRVFKGDSNFTTWDRLSLDSNNNVITIPCVENFNFTK